MKIFRIVTFLSILAFGLVAGFIAGYHIGEKHPLATITEGPFSSNGCVEQDDQGRRWQPCQNQNSDDVSAGSKISTNIVSGGDGSTNIVSSGDGNTNIVSSGDDSTNIVSSGDDSTHRVVVGSDLTIVGGIDNAGNDVVVVFSGSEGAVVNNRTIDIVNKRTIDNK